MSDLKPIVPKPQRLDHIDWKPVLEMAQVCLDESALSDSDNNHYLYETVMEAVYGSGCWRWINNELD